MAENLFSAAKKFAQQVSSKPAEVNLTPSQPAQVNPITTLYGSAVLYSGGNHDMEPAFNRQGFPGVPLALNTPNDRLGLIWRPNQYQGHALTFGATRSGKAVSSLIPAHLTYSGSMVSIDVKAELAWVTAERRRQLGQRVAILDPWDEINRRYGCKVGVREKTTRYNPLSALDPKDHDFADDVGAIASALIVPNPDDPHWTDSARELVAGLIAAAVEKNPGQASLRQVRYLLTGDDDDLAKTIKQIREQNPNSLGARKLRRFKNTGSNEISSIRSTAETQTAFLDSETLLDSLETDENPFTLDEVATSRTTVYLVLPVDRLETHGRWLRLIITQLIRAIAKQSQPPMVPVLFCLDEMGTSLGHLPMIESSYGLMAGLGIRLWGFLQDLNQLQRDYPRSWSTFISNSAILQVLNARDTNTSMYFSTMLGNQTLMKTVAPNQGGMLQGDPSALMDRITRYRSGGIGESDQPMQRALLYPEEIQRIGANDDQPELNDQLVIATGRWNVRTGRLVYYADPRMNAMFRADPRYAKPKVA